MKASVPDSGCSRSLIRPVVEALEPYVPGEQPKIPGLVKLNTNENPYPPAPRVLATIRAAVDRRLRLYPNPTSQALREGLARYHRCDPENIAVGNGADEVLALAVRAFVEPRGIRCKVERSLVQYFSPCYSLYPVLADMHGAKRRPVPLRPDFGFPDRSEREDAGWEPRAPLTFITTPNAPSGRGYRRRELETLCDEHQGVVILDEAYADFARENASSLALNRPHVMVVRTFSKGYSLCFQRIGYVVGPPPLIRAIDKIRDSYNVNGLGQTAALATLDDLAYYRRNFRRIIATRSRVASALGRLGFHVHPSQTNFLFVRPPGMAAESWMVRLRERGILVRWFPAAEVCDYLRISIGTDAEMDALLRAVHELLGTRRRVCL